MGPSTSDGIVPMLWYLPCLQIGKRQGYWRRVDALTTENAPTYGDLLYNVAFLCCRIAQQEFPKCIKYATTIQILWRSLANYPFRTISGVDRQHLSRWVQPRSGIVGAISVQIPVAAGKASRISTGPPPICHRQMPRSHILPGRDITIVTKPSNVPIRIGCLATARQLLAERLIRVVVRH